jgi:amidase
VERVLDHAIAVLRERGATVIDPVEIPHVSDFGYAEMTVLLYDFKHDLNAYLATREGLKVRNLAEVIAYNHANAASEMSWFDQNLFVQAEAKGPLTDDTYREALATAKRLSGPDGIDAAMKEHALDALLTPTSSPAWTVDLVNGDRMSGSSSSPAAVSGYPSISVPAGFVHCLPVGVSFFAGQWSEPTLIGISYAFEQATHVYRPPQFLQSVADCNQPG